MSNKLITLDESFIDELYNKLEEARLELNRTTEIRNPVTMEKVVQEAHPKDSIPDKIKFKEFLETVFWSSLQREEGRSLRFVIGYTKKIFPDESNFEFEEPWPLEINTLTRLSTITMNNYNSTISVYSINNELMITGFYKFYSLDTELKVKVLDPGKLIINYGRGNIFTLMNGIGNTISNEINRYNLPLWEVFKNTANNDSNSLFFDEKIHQIIKVLHEMWKLRHGGTLIVFPKDYNYSHLINNVNQKSFAVKNQFKALNVYLNYYLKTTDSNTHDPNKQSVAEMALAEAIEIITGFTTLDGATLITNDLNVLAFGVKLSFEDELHKITISKVDILNPSHSTEECDISIIGGTRHQSAARFVYENKDCLALVVSQDGKVTGFIWEESAEKQPRVYMYFNLERILF